MKIFRFFLSILLPAIFVIIIYAVIGKVSVNIPNNPLEAILYSSQIYFNIVWAYIEWWLVAFASFWIALFALGIGLIPVLSFPYVAYRFVSNKITLKGMKTYLTSMFLYNALIAFIGFIAHRFMSDFLINNFYLDNLSATIAGCAFGLFGCIICMIIDSKEHRMLFWYLFNEDFDT